VHNCLHLLLEATADLKVDSSETDESHSESGSDDNGDDEDGDSDSKDVCLILLNINSKQAKVLSSFGKLSLWIIPYQTLSFFENECQLSVLGDGTGHM